MIKVSIRTWWTDNSTVRDRYNRMTKNGDYIWKDLYLTNKSDYDFVVVQGSTDIIDFPLDRCIVLQNEPYAYRLKNYSYLFKEPSYNLFYRVYDIYRYRSTDHWSLNMSYNDLMDSDNFKKCRLCSGLISGLSELEGHKDRLNFVVNFLDKLPYYESHLTKKFKVIEKLNSFHGYIDDPKDSYLKYKYVFQGENSYEHNYFTEKITRSILCECLTFYSGCPNIDDFINPMCYIPLNLKDPSSSIETIKKSINDKEFEKRLPYIKDQKIKLMNEDNVLNIIWKIVHNMV